MGQKQSKPKPKEQARSTPSSPVFTKSNSIAEILKDAAISAEFRAFLRSNNQKTLDYFQCVEMIQKRRAIYQSEGRCGDKDRAVELLNEWTGNILAKYGDLQWELGPNATTMKLAINVEQSQINDFDQFETKAIEILQEYLNSIQRRS